MKVWCLVVFGWLVFILDAEALILIGRGNKPVRDSGWPAGALAVANQPSRIGWWEGPPFGGGEWHFEYRGAEEFQQAMDVFAKVQAPVLDLFVHDGTRNSFVLDPNHETATNNVDWTFTVWVPAAWQTLYGDNKPILFSDDPNAGKPMPGPRLDLYLGGNSPVAIDQVRIPASVTVHDQRASTAGVDTSAGTVVRVMISDIRSSLALPGATVTVTAQDGNGRYTKPLKNAPATRKEQMRPFKDACSPEMSAFMEERHGCLERRKVTRHDEPG